MHIYFLSSNHLIVVRVLIELIIEMMNSLQTEDKHKVMFSSMFLFISEMSV